jgi:hypothetical protein
VTEQELLAIVETLKEFKGMLWGQQITVYTDHKNLMQDALGLTSDRVYRWRLLLEEYGPTIVYIKGIHNPVADAISRLDYGPVTDDRSTWMTFAQCWCYHNTTQPEASLATTQESMNQVFANRNEEDSIYPLTTREIAEAQQEDESLLNKGYSTQLVENINVLVFYIYGRFWSLSAKWSPKNGLYNIFYGRLENTNKILNIFES